jgi:hypothetical protein
MCLSNMILEFDTDVLEVKRNSYSRKSLPKESSDVVLVARTTSYEPRLTESSTVFCT